MWRGGNVEWGLEVGARASWFRGKTGLEKGKVGREGEGGRRSGVGRRGIRQRKTSWPREGRSKQQLECRLVSWANRVPNRYTRSEQPLLHPLPRYLWFRYDLESNWPGFYRSRAMNPVARQISNPLLRKKEG